MRYNRYQFEKKPPLFRPPKYTGITLSLLSVFVLVSMLAVWEKMANVPDIPEIHILAWDQSKIPLENVRTSYQKEAACIVNVTYQPLSELSSLPNLSGLSSKVQWDIILLPKLDDQSGLYSSNKFENRGVVAYFKQKNKSAADNTNEADKPIALISLINNEILPDKEVHSFLRFLKAPTKGQVEFAINGWTGVNEDHWNMSPTLKIYAIESSKLLLNTPVHNFAEDEGIPLSISFLEENSLQKSLKILTKANNKDYLPDLVFFPANYSIPSWVNPYFSPFENEAGIADWSFSVYLRQKSPLLKTAQKLLRQLSENQ